MEINGEVFKHLQSGDPLLFSAKEHRIARNIDIFLWPTYQFFAYDFYNMRLLSSAINGGF